MSLEGNLDCSTFRDHIDTVIRMCLDEIWNDYTTDKGLMTKQHMRSFVKNLIAEMGDQNDEFTDWDFEDCYRKMGFTDQKDLHSRDDITRFIKKVVDYKQPVN